MHHTTFLLYIYLTEFLLCLGPNRLTDIGRSIVWCKYPSSYSTDRLLRVTCI